MVSGTRSPKSVRTRKWFLGAILGYSGRKTWGNMFFLKENIHKCKVYLGNSYLFYFLLKKNRQFFSRVHATLQPTLSVFWLVGRSVGNTLLFRRLWAVLGLLLLSNCLVELFHHCPCPPTRIALYTAFFRIILEYNHFLLACYANLHST